MERTKNGNVKQAIMSAINKACMLIYDDGGIPKRIECGYWLSIILKNYFRECRRPDMDNGFMGGDAYDTDFGVMSISLNQKLEDDEFVIYDK